MKLIEAYKRVSSFIPWSVLQNFKYAAWGLLLLWTSVLRAQNPTIQLSGTAVSRVDGEPLPGVAVSVKEIMTQNYMALYINDYQ